MVIMDRTMERFPVKTVHIHSKNYKLHRAAKEGNLATLISLLEGKDEKEVVSLLNTPVEEHKQITTPLIVAAAHDRLNIVEALLTKYDIHVDQTGSVYLNTAGLVRNITPVFCAASNGNLKMVTFLVEQHDADINHRAEYNHTPVLQACSNGRLEVVRYLLEHGADIHVRHAFTNSNCLISAVSKNFQEVAHFLVEKGADPNVQLQNGMTAIHLAAQVGSVDLVIALLKAGAIFELQDNRGLTALEIACEERQDDVVRYILREQKLPIEEEIRAWELLGAANVFHNNVIMGFYFMGRGMELRYKDKNENDIISKFNLINVNSDPVVYGRRPESRTIDQLKDIDTNSVHETRQEALLVMERILGEHIVLRPQSVTNYLTTAGINYQGQKQYFKCISLFSKVMNIQLNTEESICNIIQRFVMLFAEMHTDHNNILDPSLVMNLCEHCLTDLEQEWLKVQYVAYEPTVFEAEQNVKTNVDSALFLISILKTIIDEVDFLEETIAFRYVDRLLALDIRTSDRLQHSVLHVACSSRYSRYPALMSPNYNVIKLLLDRNIDIDTPDNEGNTPLHILASYNGQADDMIYKTVSLFLDAGVHVDPINKEGARPLDLANPAILERLKEATRKVSLKCLAAQTIKIHFTNNYKALLPSSLVKFVEMHS